MQIKNLLYDDTMDCYRPNADAYSGDISDMLESDIDVTMFQQESLKEPVPYPATMPAVHMLQDSYSCGSPDNYSNGSQGYPVAHAMQDYKFPPCSIPSKASVMDPAISTLDWLQPMSNGLQHHPITSNTGMMMDTSNSIANADQSVHNQSVTAKILSLPNSVQISGGNVNYVSMPNATQQVYISPNESVAKTPPQSLPDCTDNCYRSRSNSNSSFVLSPNSAPTSTVSENPYPKPAYSYSCLIALALKNSQHGSLPVAEIYSFMMRHFPYFKTAPDGWKNSVRHNLSLNKCFEKIENPNADGTNSRKGCLWALNPAKVKKMDEEIFKWNKKDPIAIKRAMVHPEVLDALSKGQESFSSRNGMKRVAAHNRQSQLRNAIQHQPMPGQRHHHRHSPSLSPDIRSHNNRSSSMMVNTTSANGMSVPISNQPALPEHQHAKQLINGNGTASDVFTNGNGQINLDSSLSEIAIQNGLFDELPAELLDYPYTYSPSAFLMSPKKPSDNGSPAAPQMSQVSPVQTNVSRGTLIPLGQN